MLSAVIPSKHSYRAAPPRGKAVSAEIVIEGSWTDICFVDLATTYSSNA